MFFSISFSFFTFCPASSGPIRSTVDQTDDSIQCRIAWSGRAFESLPKACNLHIVQAKVLLSRDHTDGVGVALSAAPTLDTDDVVALVDDAELESVVDTPLEAAVHVLLPDLNVEVGLGLGECEGPDAAVQVRVLVACQLPFSQRIEDQCQLTREAMGLRVTMRMGQTGRYLERRRAVFPLVQSVNRAVLHWPS